MKKIFYLFSFLITLSCSDNTPVNDCFRGIEINAIIDLTLPEFQGLLVPDGESQNIIQGRNIYIFRTGSNGYKAFDRQCPETTCNSLMTFDGVHIICPCDDKKYNYLANGAQIENEGCAALMYFVTQINSSQLRISR
ncbi:Rieske (2Fe-2S) protein [Tenacibaculum retecalamus]|uniref:Rieske 2Fe-2S domain-containing protein n=1 Tax=Tenacibaculum retecalamus TaxID=3018315 RepID=UPI0023D95201|nr:Rieske 2Fe-2S domain-containing protein [Tenacibaculum retecalamus]WBX71793.1 Rieske 2Fe-2S domain-containing protein [Tenacibaculum retecalamus]